MLTPTAKANNSLKIMQSNENCKLAPSVLHKMLELNEAYSMAVR